MKNKIKGITGLFLVLTLLIVSGTLMAANTKDITILQTSDMHGNIYPWAYVTGEYDNDVGLAKVYTLVKQVREENPNTLLVDDGDTIQGTNLTDDVFRDRYDVVHPMMKVMNFMKYDSWTPGNHEFNFGVENLKEVIADAEMPVISANITYKDSNKLFADKPYIIKDVDGVKVGILGLSTPNIPRWDGDKVTELAFAGLSSTASKYIPEMKADGADVIVVVAHAGLDGRYDPDGGDKASKIAEENPDVDVMLLGHDHDEVNTTVNGVLVAAPEDKGHQVVRVDLSLAQENGKWVVKEKKATHLETRDVEAAPEVLEVARMYHDKTVEYVETPIGEATADFVPENAVKGIPAAQVQDTALVDLINRVQLKYTGADISAAALFDSNSNIEEGPVSIKVAARIYKYANTLYSVKVTGKELKDYMEWSAAYYNTYKPGDVTVSFNPDIRGYNYDMFAGVDYKIDISKPAGERIVDLTYQGKPVRDDQEFLLAINNYRYSGLKSDGIIHNEPESKSTRSVQDFIIEYIKDIKVLIPECDNNWELVGADLSHWAKAEAIALMNKGVLEVPSENRSWNGASLNLLEKAPRGNYAKALVRLFNLDLPAKVEEPSFSDVDEEYVPYAEALKNAGISSGVAEGKFGPDQVLTREEAAVMLVKAMKIAYYPEAGTLDQFKDSDQVSNWARFDLARAVGLGLVSGYPDNTLRPQHKMTMGEVSALLYKYLAKFKTIDILSTNDFHGNIEGGYEAGAAMLAGAIKHYVSANPEGTIILDAGDSYQGTPVSTLNHGEPVIKTFNYLGYTAQAIGNHEFDWGIAEMKKMMEKADYPFLAANIYNKATGEPVDWAKPYLMREVNGLKVGIIGISTIDTQYTVMPSNIVGLEFKDPATIINTYTDQLRAMGADLVLVLGHLPGHADYKTGEIQGGELIDTANQVHVDGIVGGHSHATVYGIVNGIPVIEAYKNGRELGHLRYYVDKESGKIYKSMPVTHTVRGTAVDIAPDKNVEKIVKTYQKELEPIMSEVLAIAPDELKRDYNNISGIGALITDVMREKGKADVAFQNPGGIRIDIPAGKVTVGQLYSLLPFGNTVVTGEMTGSQLVEILEQSLTLDKGMMQLSGLQVKYDSSKPAYNRVVAVTLADGTPVKMNEKYTVATNNFLAEGGDKFTTFAEVEFTDSFITVREAVTNYLRKLDTIDPDPSARMIDVSQQVMIYTGLDLAA